jgi:hypothetical protein
MLSRDEIQSLYIFVMRGHCRAVTDGISYEWYVLLLTSVE